MPRELLETLVSAERRIGFVSSQLSGVMASELHEALAEIRRCIAMLVPERETQASQTVLFVDDEEIIRRIGTQMLKREGYEVLTASNGVEALGIFEQNRERIGCVVLDLVMPVMDGLQTFEHLRELAPDLGVILITGYCEDEVKKRFGELKLQGFLRKPFTASALSEMVSKAAAHAFEGNRNG